MGFDALVVYHTIALAEPTHPPPAAPSLAAGDERTHMTTDEDPVLVAGHSLGGAVANLLADHLTDCNGSDGCPVRSKENVYAYTFASPTVTNEPKVKHANELRNNIFNILNCCKETQQHNLLMVPAACCDVVTHVPGFLLPGTWSRYGLEAHIDMVNEDVVFPYGSLNPLDKIGVNHKMPTYVGLMDALPDDTTWANIMSYDTCPSGTH